MKFLNCGLTSRDHMFKEFSKYMGESSSLSPQQVQASDEAYWLSRT